MQWIHDFQLVLFDLDGLLVNTEELHFCAYKQMLATRGFELTWDFHRYCHTAHYHADKIGSEFYQTFPALLQQESSWDVLYNEKKKIMIDLLSNGEVQLMPGAEVLLRALADANIKHCVVTHSPDDLIRPIRKQHPSLDAIPFWITRKDYVHPKPHSECYEMAIKLHAQAGDRIIGFEDTPRGLTALMGTPAKPMLICTVNYPEIPTFVAQGVQHFPTFNAIPSGSFF
jgi:beta-phosphoglucomutase